jgi:hypothetical protein
VTPARRSHVVRRLRHHLQIAVDDGNFGLADHLRRMIVIAEQAQERETMDQQPAWWKSIAFVLSLIASLASALAAVPSLLPPAAQHVAAGVATVLTILGFRGALLMSPPGQNAKRPATPPLAPEETP